MTTHLSYSLPMEFVTDNHSEDNNDWEAALAAVDHMMMSDDVSRCANLIIHCTASPHSSTIASMTMSTLKPAP